MIKVTINGKAYEAEKGENILDVCRRNRVLIPTLCHHEGLSGLGSCRLCVVEVDEGRGNKVVVSCVYPLSRDCKVFTESEKIKGIRRTLLSMLITRAPAGDRLASLCQIYGVPLNRGSADKRFTFPRTKTGNSQKDCLAEACVLCGLCAQACASLGTGAISTVGRGVIKKVSTPYDDPSVDCIGCLSCASVCPTKAIKFTEGKSYRSIWGRKFQLIRCESCGKAFATPEEYALALKKSAIESAVKTAPIAHDTDDSQPPVICDTCRKKKSTDVMAKAFGERKTGRN